MHYLDTCICIEFLRGRLKAGYEEMRRNRPEEYQVPSIVAAELFFGAEHSVNPDRETGIVEQFVETFTVAPFDLESAHEYGRLRQLLGARGNLIGDRDLMIASCALANRATLVTNNVKEFERVPGLKLESWRDVELKQRP